MFRNKIGVAVKDLIEQAGPQGAVDIIREVLEEGKYTPEELFSLREIWYATEGDKDVSEAISSDMFPQITSEIINKKLIDAYNRVKVIGDMLTTTVSSNMEIETVAGFDASENPEEVPQGHEYEDSNITEKYVTIPHTKYGRLISITEEMIYFDKSGQILTRAQGIGEKAAQYKEKLIVEGIQDINSDVFRPSGVPTAFYRTAASGDRKINSKSSTAFGESGLEEAFKLMHNMTDENGDYVYIDTGSLYLLVPQDLWLEALQMSNSTLTPESAENAVNVYKGAFTPLTSPYITAQNNGYWYIGDFKRDFWWSEVWPLQTFTMKPGNEQEFRRDVKATFKVRFYGQIGAVDDKHSYKFTD